MEISIEELWHILKMLEDKDTKCEVCNNLRKRLDKELSPTIEWRHS